MIDGDKVNRDSSSGTSDKLKSLGWVCHRSLAEYIGNIVIR